MMRCPRTAMNFNAARHLENLATATRHLCTGVKFKNPVFASFGLRQDLYLHGVQLFRRSEPA